MEPQAKEETSRDFTEVLSPDVGGALKGSASKKKPHNRVRKEIAAQPSRRLDLTHTTQTAESPPVSHAFLFDCDCWLNPDALGTRVHEILERLCEQNENERRHENALAQEHIPFQGPPYPELLLPLVMQLARWPRFSRAVVVSTIALMDRLQTDGGLLLNFETVDKTLLVCFVLSAKTLEDVHV